MKKLISVLMIVAMIASIAAVSTSAAGQILFVDTFEGDELDPANWIIDGNLFYVEEGWCKGWGDAVVNQSYFYDEDKRPDGNKNWSTFSAQVDVAFFDFDKDGEDHTANLWWKDYVIDPEYGDEGKGTIYEVVLHLEKRTITLDLSGDFLPEDHENPVATFDIPDEVELNVDASNPSIAQLGMRVQPNQVDAYINGIHAFSYTPTAPIGTMKSSPILLVNRGMYIGFDNFTVATVDYPLFAADNVVDPNPQPPVDDPVDPQPPVEGGDPVDPQPPVEGGDPVDPQPPVEGGDQNNAQPQKPADTNQGANNQQPSTGTQTGDAAIVVLAVMIVALGTAVAVKKISVR